ncbi:hypothetical protein QMW73_15330 [Cronobacter sakazakii]|uniref:hypothetical protein n=1 Tax=Cronobacter sakazakii TaxID=28141 RepID=UPI00187CCEA9|nr:hypothetical protein [Cronobacter sakazakii]MDK1308283.1 hypothetical protein [Cronobacter sakazakii]
MALSSCEMALVVWPCGGLRWLHGLNIQPPATPQTHLVWYLFALCQRTVEVKERCQSVPFGYQRPADGLSITASGFIVNTAGDKKSQAVLMFMIYKIIYFSAHF